MIETERLTLTLISPNDSQFLLELMNTDKWLQYIGDRNISTEQDAQNYMQERMHADLKVKGFINHVITERASQSKVGTCSIHDREGVDGLDVGYALLPQFEGQGFASEAVREMIRLVEEEYRKTEVSAICNETNLDSRKLLERLGFKKIGVAEKFENNVLLYKKKLNPPGDWQA